MGFDEGVLHPLALTESLRVAVVDKMLLAPPLPATAAVVKSSVKVLLLSRSISLLPSGIQLVPRLTVRALRPAWLAAASTGALVVQLRRSALQVPPPAACVRLSDPLNMTSG